LTNSAILGNPEQRGDLVNPLVVELALLLDVNPDPLERASIAASCAFLTPIGRQNNTPRRLLLLRLLAMGLPSSCSSAPTLYSETVVQVRSP
jgi:hypothetical protein